MDLDAVLTRAVGMGASDVHLKVGQPPVVRKDGELVVLEGVEPLDDSDLDGVLRDVTVVAPGRRESLRRERRARSRVHLAATCLASA